MTPDPTLAAQVDEIMARFPFAAVAALMRREGRTWEVPRPDGKGDEARVPTEAELRLHARELLRAAAAGAAWVEGGGFLAARLDDLLVLRYCYAGRDGRGGGLSRG